MLAALREDVRVYAHEAEKGPAFLCPSCRAEVILRKGTVRVHHFAHKPPVVCGWGQGETEAHLAAKQAVFEALRPRSRVAEIEWPLSFLQGDRRADVFIEEMTAGPIAFELQHTPIGLPEIEARTCAYLEAGIAVVWLAFLDGAERFSARRGETRKEGDWVIERYRPRPFERWIAAFGQGELWYYAPRTRKLFRGRLDDYVIDREGLDWWSGGETSAGSLASGHWKTLRLWGPVDLAAVAIRRMRRREAELGPFRLPAGPAVRLLPAGEM
jgi:competence protein CoiA